MTDRETIASVEYSERQLRGALGSIPDLARGVGALTKQLKRAHLRAFALEERLRFDKALVEVRFTDTAIENEKVVTKPTQRPEAPEGQVRRLRG